MKKVIALALTATIGLSLVGCGGNSDKKEDTSANKSTEQEIVQEVTYEKFESLLNSFANEEYYYNEINTLKLLSKEDETAYIGKAEVELDKVLTDNNIDKATAKIYPYYRNANGTKDQVTYVITYGTDNTASKVYEVYSNISKEYEITFKEIKENTDLMAHKQFAELFKGEF